MKPKTGICVFVAVVLLIQSIPAWAVLQSKSATDDAAEGEVGDPAASALISSKASDVPGTAAVGRPSLKNLGPLPSSAAKKEEEAYSFGYKKKSSLAKTKPDFITSLNKVSPNVTPSFIHKLQPKGTTGQKPIAQEPAALWEEPSS